MPVRIAPPGAPWRVHLPNGGGVEIPEHTERADVCHGARMRERAATLECLRTQRRAMQHRDHDAVRKSAREIARAYSVLGLESLNIKGMGTSARGRSDTGVGAKRALNRRIRAGLWGFTQTTLANAMEGAGAVALRLPAMDSSRTDAECGHVDAENRKGKAFRCIRCARVDDADVNAAKVMRQRALRWLALKSV